MTNLLLLVVIDAAAWGALSVVVGYAAHRWPSARLARDGRWTRIRRWEDGGRFYDRSLHIKAWKDRIPELGGAFGGVSKRSLRSLDRPELEQLVLETRRAELVHLWLFLAGPFFLLWNPWWLGCFMVAYGVIANVPCLIIQRYNRARLQRILARHPA